MVLAALVVISLILITAGFGATDSGSAGGPFGALGAGASKIAKPVRDLVHWVGDTAHAKGQNQALKREAGDLRIQVAQLQTRLRNIPNEAKLQALVDRLKLTRNDPVAANVIGQSPTAWASTIGIDKGVSDGIEVGQAVVGAAGPGAGLVGFISAVHGSRSSVSLLPDQGRAVGARLDGKNPILTVQGAGAGTSSDLELLFVPSTTPIPLNSLVVTSGTTGDTDKYTSLAPRDLPIGRVTSVDKEGQDDQVAHLRPLVDLRTLETVEVLTTSVDGNRKP
jgi:rod shape-determining protein MreC